MASVRLLKLFPPKQVRRYLFSGVTAFISEYGMFIVLYKVLECPLILSNSISFLIGLIISFSLQRSWTFQKSQFQKALSRQFLLYSLLAVFNLLMINLMLSYLKHRGLDPRLGKVMVMLLVVYWNFLLFRSIIFKPDQAKQL